MTVDSTDTQAKVLQYQISPSKYSSVVAALLLLLRQRRMSMRNNRNVGSKRAAECGAAALAR